MTETTPPESEHQAALPTDVPPFPTAADRRTFRRRLWWASGEPRRLTGDLLVATLVGLLIAGGTIVAQTRIDTNATERAERLASDAELAAQRRDNLRFVREIAAVPPGAARPFDRLDLTGATLAGLPLGCDDPAATECTRFNNAQLVNVNAVGADLRGAHLRAANLDWANLQNADLRYASLQVSRLTATAFNDADLRGTDLMGASVDEYGPLPVFKGADVRGAIFAAGAWPEDDEHPTLEEVMSTTHDADDQFLGACWDETTVWPDGFTPPPSAPEACQPG